MAKLQRAEEYVDAGDEDDDEASDSSDGDGEDAAEEVLQQEPRPDAVYNTMALHEKLEDIGWTDDLDWLQTLSVVHSLDEEDVDVNDDLSREMAFYTQALEGSREAFGRFLKAGKPFLRPPDYYAEMVKSDSHMLKVKGRLLSQRKRVEEAEEHRKAREAKRFSKEVQALKLKQRAQEKKENIESVRKWRKMRQRGGFGGGEDEELMPDFGEDDNVGRSNKRKAGSDKRGAFKKLKGLGDGAAFDYHRKGGRKPPSGNKKYGESRERVPFEDAGGKKKHNPRLSFGGARNDNRMPAPWDRSGGKNNNNRVKGKPSMKRQSRNAKYGHGGKKSFKKANTNQSYADFSRANKK